MTDYEATLKAHNEKCAERAQRLTEFVQRSGFAGKTVSADKANSTTDKTVSDRYRPLATASARHGTLRHVSDQGSMRERVQRLEAIVQQLPQVECQIRHHFAPGVYAREMTIPAPPDGFIHTITGAVHKTEHLWILSAGHCWMTSPEGEVIEASAPHTGRTVPGMKRAISTLTGCVMTTIHPTTTTDLEALVEELTESTAAELLGGEQNKQALTQKQKGEIE